MSGFLIPDTSIHWAFLVAGPRSSLNCLPLVSPWWSSANKNYEWEVWIPNEQHVRDSNKQFELAQQTIVKMNGLATSIGEPGLIEMTHLVAYDEGLGRSISIPLRLAIKVTTLSGLGSTTQVPIDFTLIHPDNLTAFSELLDYWGQPNSETYEGLYKIYEWVESVAPDLVAKAISKNQKSRMKQTCNHWSFGPTTRHVEKAKDPPVQPMPLTEIRNIIRKLSGLYVQSITKN